jgi:uncharacterized protein (TIGR02231 family)
VEKPGNFTFELSYMIMGASWQPIYDIRSWSDTNAVDLIYLAMVNQQTGEDWNAVNLELSTAQPAIGANPPMLNAWYLNAVVPLPIAKADAGRRGSENMPIDKFLTSPGFVREGGLLQSAAQYATADISHEGVSTSFTLRQKETIPSSGELKKVPIKTASFTAETEHIAVPRFSDKAYLKATVVNHADFPLLRGKASIFLDGNFVSTAGIPLVLPQESFDLYIGADEGVKIKRELVQKFTDDAGVMNKKRRISYEYKITLQNFHKTNQKLTILDQLPISQNEAIEVKLTDSTPPPQYQPDDQQRGFLRWVLDLKPTQKQEIDFKYQVKYPQEISITGLE